MTAARCRHDWYPSKTLTLSHLSQHTQPTVFINWPAGEAKSLKKPPAGVDDITAVVIILLEGNPKDKSWGAAQKLMNNVDKFLERLKGFKVGWSGRKWEGAVPLVLCASVSSWEGWLGGASSGCRPPSALS